LKEPPASCGSIDHDDRRVLRQTEQTLHRF
jgi:hypothetical protein